jgi:glycosyltransferase involved in cell wall biosynthesis
MFLTNPFEVDSRVLKEARSAAADGFDVTVLATAKEGLPAEESRDGFRVLRLRHGANLRIWRRFGWYRCCLAWCLRNRPAIIHVNDLDPLPAGWLAARLTGAGLVYDSHELWSQGQALAGAPAVVRWALRWTIRRVERFFAARTDANFQVTTALAEVFARQYGLPQPKTLRNCPTFQDVQRTERLRQMSGLAPDARLVLYCGSLGGGRGIEPALQAIELLPENVHMIFLGHGLPGPIEEFQRTSPRGRRAHRLQAVPYEEIVPTISSADVGLALIQNTSLSYYMSLPNKLCEYMMAGLPTVGSDFPEIGRVIRDVQFGELVDPDDPQAIAAAVRKILDDPALWQRYHENALAGRRKYCWENQVTGLLEEYRRLAASRQAK